VTLAERMLAIQPGLPVLLISGSMEEELQERILRAGWPFLPKPFTPAALLAAVQALIGPS
jgi:DNA-binding response OmpR family regulator